MPGADVDTARPRARTVYRAAAALYRQHFGVIIGLAALVLVPFAVLDALGILEVHIRSDAAVTEIGVALLTLVATGLSGLASIFYAGTLDHASAAWHRGEVAPTPRAVAGRLPWAQLVLASIIWFVVVGVGLLLAIVPGFVALTLFSLTGPVLVREELTAVPALRRSAQLVWRRPMLVIITAVAPYLVEVYVGDLAAAIFGHSVPVELVVEVLATLFLASFVGVLEVVTAHQLIAAERA